MAFTNHSGLFAAVHENGINATIGHLMWQRPSLFNYATLIFIGQSGDRTRSSSKSTLLIVYFNDKDVVTDYRLSAIKY